MHIYFSGIGGVGIGPLALLAKQAGYEVSGSDIKQGQFVDYLRHLGIGDISIGQTKESILTLHAKKPIDWLVYSSALPKTDPNHPELEFAREHNIKTSKRDELLIEILSQKHLKLLAIAGTHGKTTTTAMIIWGLKEIGLSPSYSVGARISFGDMGHFDEASEYFVYECDEFDRNFLAFHPYMSIISGVAYDHHEIYPSQDDYNQAFRQFISQSQWVVAWEDDAHRLGLDEREQKYALESYDDKLVEKIKLGGLYNRRDALLGIKAIHYLTNEPVERLLEIMSRFPGVSRRFEKLVDNLYTDDAHTPEKILGCMSVAGELSAKTGQKIIVIYEPLTNRRMHHLGSAHRDVFEGASAIYWLPSYLAREDPAQPVLPPEKLIRHLSPEHQKVAKPMAKNDELRQHIKNHLKNGDLVIAMAGGGAGSLDEWLRNNFVKAQQS